MDIDRSALLENFVVESEEHLDAIEESLIGLEANPDDETLLEAIFRAAHTFKGNAFVVGLNALGEFAHAFETILDQLRTRQISLDGRLASVALAAVDAFRQLVARVAAGDGDEGAERHPAHGALLRWLAQRDVGADAPAAGAEAVTSHESARARERSTIRVETAKLDRLIDLVGEMAIARGRISTLLQAGSARAAEALDVHEATGQLFLDLHEQVMKMRLVSIGPTLRPLSRTVRDVSLSLGKSARLVLVGEDVEIDTALVERMRDPLVHMIRNALDHGIEQPEARRTEGKDPTGTITVRVWRDGEAVVIEVSDDGTGLDREKLLAVARARGAAAESLSDAELFTMVFDAGFTTADHVTELSGRGVGMSVVRRNIESLRGRISVRSTPGRGTTFTIRLPLTLSIIDGFSVGAGGETFILPMESVLECIDLPDEEAGGERDRGVTSIRGEPLPFLRLGRFFGLAPAGGARESVVVIREGPSRVGLVVDALHGGGQVVVKPLGRWFENVRGISASTLLGNGRVALLLDVAELLIRSLETEEARARSA